MSMDGTILIVVTVILSLGVFFIIRNLLLWYFRIDEMIKRQDEIIRQLVALNKGMTGVDTTPVSPAQAQNAFGYESTIAPNDP